MMRPTIAPHAPRAGLSAFGKGGDLRAIGRDNVLAPMPGLAVG
jgi:hypothetical protein